MSALFDAKMTGGNAGTGGNTQEASGVTSISSTGMTIGATANLLVVGLSFIGSGTNVSNITATWNGVAMTPGPVTHNNGSQKVSVAMFYLLNPATGNHTLAASWTGTGDCYMGCTSWIGADATTPIVVGDNQTTQASTIVTIPTANGDATVACSCKDSNTPTSNFTIFYGESNLNPGGGGSYNQSTGTSDVHTHTYSGGSVPAAVGVHIKAGSGSTAITGTPATVATVAGTGIIGPTAITGTSITVASFAGIGQVNSVLITGTSATVVTNVRIGQIDVTPPNPVKIADRGKRTSTGTGTATVTLTNPTLIAVGNYLVARVAVDNSGASGARPGLTCSDARNSTWAHGTGGLQDPGAASAGAAVYLCYIKVTTLYQAGDAVTFTWATGTPVSAIVIEEWANIDQTTPLAVAETQANNVSSTAQPSIARTPLAAGQLVYVAAALEGFSSYWGAQDSDAFDGSWVDLTKDEANTGTAATSISVYGGAKAVTSTNTQTWNNTIGTTSDWAACAVVFARRFLTSSIMGISVEVNTNAGVGVIASPTPIVGTSATVASVAGTGAITGNTALAGTSATVASIAGTGVITGNAAVVGTSATVASVAGTGIIGVPGTTDIIGTSATVIVAAGTGVITANAVIAGASTSVIVAAGIGQIGVGGSALNVNQVFGKSGPNAATLTTDAVTTISGSLIVAIATGYNISGTPANGWMTDSKGNSWIFDPDASTIGGFESIGVWYQDGGTRGASHTITFTPTGASNLNLHVIEITGHVAGAALDTTTDAVTADTTSPYGIPPAASITGTQIAIVTTAVGDLGDGTWTDPTGYTPIFLQGTSAQRCCAGSWYKIGETGTPTPTSTFSNAAGQTARVSIVTFKGVAGTSIIGTPATVIVTAGSGEIGGGTTNITGTSTIVLVYAGVGQIGPVTVLCPVTVSGRKILDQNGNVYLARTFSSWGMFKLTDASITTALEGLASRHFNGVTVWIGGGAKWDTNWLPYYENDDGENYWTGTPWQSSLGPAWSTIDFIVSECARLGMVAHLSLGISWSNTGPAGDIAAATNAQMRQVGIDVATRYLAAPNIVWHVMFDDSQAVAGTIGQRVEAYFGGINDTEGATTRPVRWCEVDNPTSTNGRGWLNTTNAKFSINCLYKYTDNSAEQVETVWGEVTTVPVGDCEPPYDGANHYSGDQGQQLRERSYAVFLEGGCLINYGSEAWWAFGPPDRAGSVPDYENLGDWHLVPDHIHTVQQQYVWDLLDLYVADPTWAPATFVTTGEGSGDTKAAVGASSTAAIAYFPSSRTVAVDTTIIAGTGNVRLRWYNPYNGTFTSIATSEAQQTGRAVTYPSSHSDATNDWVLVVDSVAASVGITGTSATVVSVAGTGVITADTAIVGTGATVAIFAGTGTLSATTNIIGTGATVVVFAGTGTLTATTNIDGVGATVAVIAGVGIVTANAAVTGTGATVAVFAGVGTLTATTNIIGTGGIVSVTADTGTISTQITGSSTIVAIFAGTGTLSATTAISGTSTIVNTTAGIGQIIVGSDVVGITATVFTNAGTGILTATTAISGTGGVVAIAAGIGTIVVTSNIIGTSATVVSVAGTGIIGPQTVITGSSETVIVIAGTGTISGQANVLGISATVAVFAGTGNISGQTSITGSSETVIVIAGTGTISTQINIIGVSAIVVVTAGTGIISGQTIISGITATVVVRTGIGHIIGFGGVAKQGAILVV